MLRFHDFFSNNRFLSNFMFVKNMMLCNENANKNETLPGSIVFLDTKDVTFLTLFTIYIDIFDSMKL